MCDLLRAATRLEELTAGEIATEHVLEARAGEPLSEAVAEFGHERGSVPGRIRRRPSRSAS